MTYADIARAITKTLKGALPGARVYSMGRVEAVKRPAFYFALHPVLTEASNIRTRHNVVSVIIDFLQEEKDEAEMYEVASKVRDALGWSYQCGDGWADVVGFTFELVTEGRNVLEMDVTLDYFEELDVDEKADLMEDAVIRMEMEAPDGKRVL